MTFSPVKLIFLGLCVAFGFTNILSSQLPVGFVRERIATGLNPTSMVLAPDGRIFITEKNGVIRIVRDDQLLDEPLLTLEVEDSNERGLGHIALHPDFDHNGYFYLFYSIPSLRSNRLSRFTAIGDKAIPGSELILVDLDETGSDVHNGGAMLFGLDGYLYVTTGEGGQNWRSEDLGSTNGKVLRLDEIGQPVPDNPWFDFHYGRANMVYAYGLRNPFTMTMNPLTGELYFNDVGSNKFEEVNRIAKGAFYGWPRLEGKKSGEKLPQEYLDPVFQYAHQNAYCAIVGSTFYYPEVIQFPEKYEGRYFYSDYCTGDIRMLDVESGQDLGSFISDGDRVVDMFVSPKGSFYYLERKGIGDGSPEDNNATNEGILWKVSYTGSGIPFISVQPESKLTSIGEDAVFSVKAFGETPLAYTWFINGEEIAGNDFSEYNFLKTSIEEDSTSVSVIVTNALGQAVSDTVLLYVTNNHRPEPMIISPVEGTTYSAGKSLLFSGNGFDTEDGILPATGLSWRIDFHHGSHSHPAMPWTSGVTSGEWIIPSVGETSSDVWYRLYLNGTDSDGLSKITYRDIRPQFGTIDVHSFPEGLTINLDGAAFKTPFMIDGVAGVSRYISAPLKQVHWDSIYFFNQWNDGTKLINHEVRPTNENQRFEGKFLAIAKGQGHGLTAKYYDNIDFSGTPVLIQIDSVINHQFYAQSPAPSVPEDNFSIQWDGYLQAYHSGQYHFTAFADDGIYLAINHDVILENWEPGVHQEEGSVYLEANHLYPITVRMYEAMYNSQVRLRWSSADFIEEVIPSSQLYASDYLTMPNIFSVVAIEAITATTLEISTESYKEKIMDFTLASVIGQTFISHNTVIPVGKNIISFDISRLTPGIYFLTGIDSISGEKTTLKFVKVD